MELSSQKEADSDIHKHMEMYTLWSTSLCTKLYMPPTLSHPQLFPSTHCTADPVGPSPSDCLHAVIFCTGLCLR